MLRRYLWGRGRSPFFAIAKRLALKAYSPGPKGEGVGIFYLHRALDPATPAKDWRRVLGHPDTEEILLRIGYLRQHFDVISLSDALDLLSAGKKIRGRFAVLTVDDGYRDFFTNLKPILEAEQVPATLFVCSSAIESGTIWYQQLYDLIEGIKSDRICVPFADRHLYFGDVRHRVLAIERFLAAHLKRLKMAKARKHLSELLESNRVETAAGNLDRFCTLDDLSSMKQSRWIELHLHSHYHHPFERLSTEEAAADLSRCTQFFSDNLGVRSRVLSYPNGESREELIPTLQSNGIEWALSTRAGIERGGDSSRFFLRRLGLDNAPFDWFRYMVSKQFHRT